MKTIEPIELMEWLYSDNPPVLINVLPAESFKNERIPYSKNVCIYRLDFNSQIEEQFPDRDTPIVVYGFGDPYLAGQKAAKRLMEMGYKKVTHFDGGLIAWGGHLLEMEGEGEVYPHLSESFQLPIDLSECYIAWTGRNLANSHTGKIRFKSGRLKFLKGVFAGGDFSLDMSSMSNDDIEDKEHNQMLIGHLKSEDFWDVDNFPEALFKIEKVKEISNVTWGTPNYRLKGILMARGLSQQIKFNALGGWNEEKKFIAQGQINIDRTWFGSIYGSGRFFEHLGKHMVADLVTIQVRIVTVKY